MLEVAGHTDKKEDSLVILNVVCWGTAFNVFFPTAGNRRSAAVVWQTFVVAWLRVFGPPQILLVDGGGEFTGEGFTRPTERWGMLIEVSDADAP